MAGEMPFTAIWLPGIVGKPGDDNDAVSIDGPQEAVACAVNKGRGDVARGLEHARVGRQEKSRALAHAGGKA